MSIYQSTKVLPYVYQLTHKTTGQFYIGYREANLVPSDQDLPIYKSSSNKVDELRFENFDTQIVAEFFDGDSAWYQEQRMIEANIKNPLCLNGYFIKDGKKKFSMGGRSHSDKTKAKISIGNRVSKPQTKEQIKNRIDILKRNPFAFKGMLNKNHSTVTKTKMSIASLGKSKSVEHIVNMKFNSNNYQSISCPHCGKVGQLTNMKRWHFDNCKVIKPRETYTCLLCNIICDTKETYNRYHRKCQSQSDV